MMIPRFARLGLCVLMAAVAGCQNPGAAPALGDPGTAGPTAISSQSGMAGEAPAYVSESRHLTTLAEATPVLSATASAANTNYGAARAVDTNLATEWQSGTGANPALILDRGGNGSLTGLAIKANTGIPYTIEVSDDGVSYRQVLANQTNTTWNTENKSFPAGTTGRYVRLRFAVSGKNVMVFEATPQGTLTPAAPAARTAPDTTTAPATGLLSATASAANVNYGAARTIDTNLNTEWQSGTGANPSLTLDRGGAGPLTGLAIKANTGIPYAVDVSDDGVTFRPVHASLSNTTWNTENKSFPAGTTGRYVRLRFTNNGKNVMVFEATPQGTLSAGAPTAPSNAPTPAATPIVSPTAQPTLAPIGSAISTRFGNQSVPRGSDNTHAKGYVLMQELGMNTIREGWNWKHVEVEKHKYVTWMNYFDDKVTKFAAMGTKVQAMITDTPDWASSNPTYASRTVWDANSLGKYTVPAGLNKPMFADGTDVYKPGVAINRDNYFASYMFDMVTRYKGRIAYWQMWNEPDFPSGDLGAGTTGSTGGTRYWAGSVQDYVRLLKVGHTITRGVDPASRITLGGLGYEKYLAAIIDNGGAQYFDIVDFHAYGTDKSSSNGVLNSAWGFLGRYNAMKQVLQAKGVTGKTFAASETGMTANNAGEQASYVTKVFATGLGLGDVETVQWAVFTNPGHLNIGLVDQATLSVKNLGYKAYMVATRQLTGAVSVRALTGTGVQGYEFRKADGRTLYVAWSSGTSATVTLPQLSGQVLDKLGAVKNGAFAGGNLSLTAEPVYVVVN